MRILTCEQGSEEWVQARLGVCTASEFDKIITPGKMKASTQAVGYRRKLLAEWITGQPSDGYRSDWMDRGNEIEAQARTAYAFMTDNEVTQVGFVYRDGEMVGASPDGLIGKDGGLELKCPAPHTHVGYLLDNKVPTAYIAQIQGNMWVCERRWWDFMSYYPGMDPLIVRVERDDVFIDKLASLVDTFVATMLEERELLIKRGIVDGRAA